jgi:hypothetical protein
MDRFSQDRIAQTGLQRVGEHKINGTAEEAFQKFLQAHVGVKCVPFELDQEMLRAYRRFARYYPAYHEALL